MENQFLKDTLTPLAIQIKSTVWSTVHQWGNFEKNALGNSLVENANQIEIHLSCIHPRHSSLQNQEFFIAAQSSNDVVKLLLMEAFETDLLNIDQYLNIVQLIKNLGNQLEVIILKLESIS